MGCGASAGVSAAVEAASVDEPKATLAGLSEEQRHEVQVALTKEQDANTNTAELAKSAGFLGHEFRGVSVDYIATIFLKEAESQGHARNALVYEVEPTVIRPKGASVLCPRDGKMGAAYVDCLRGVGEASLATIMLSYTWGYAIGDIADGLLEYCHNASLPSSVVYVWVCCLCINQFRVKEAERKGEAVPFGEFQKAFQSRVEGIGSVVALMSPWREPQYVKRVWCDFELFTAVELGEESCHVEITMPPRESEDMRRAVMTGEPLDKMWKALSDLQVQHAQATVEDDRVRILRMIQEGPGFHRLNSRVAEYLQAWIVQSCEGYLRKKRQAVGLPANDLAQICHGVGDLLSKVRRDDMLERAADLLEEAQRLRGQPDAGLLKSIGVVRQKRGNLCEALEAFTEGRRLHEISGTLWTLNGARLLEHTGSVRHQIGNLNDALQDFELASAIREQIAELETSEGAGLLNSMALVTKQKGDINAARSQFQDAKRIRMETNTLEQPGGGNLLIAMAIMEKDAGRLDDAIAIYQEAQRIFEQIGMMETAVGAKLILDLAIARSEQGAAPGCILEAFEESKHVLEATGTSETPLGAKLMMNIAVCRGKMGDGAGKLIAYEEALRIYTQTGAIESFGAADLYVNLGNARYELGKFDGALECYENAGEIHEKAGTLGTNCGLDVLIAIETTKAKIAGDVIGDEKKAEKFVEAEEEEEMDFDLFG